MTIPVSRILLVDDDEIFRGVVQLMLEQLGYEVTSARGGREALHLCKGSWFDLVITDLIMPEQDGLETITQLLQCRPGTKVIAMSGRGHIAPESSLKVARLLGASRILMKPFTPVQLQEAVEEILGPPRAAG